MKSPRLALALALCVFAHPTPARAHLRSASYSTVRIAKRGAELEVRLSLLDLSALESAGVEGALAAAEPGLVTPTWERFLTSRLVVASDRGPCATAPGSVVALSSPRDAARMRWSVRCDAPPTKLEARLVHDLPGHTHFARVVQAGTTTERVLSAATPTARLDVGASEEGALPVASRFLTTGALHVWTGPDHVAFLLLAVSMLASRRARIGVLTGFTLGHSLTLALVTLGLLTPRTNGVEALIGLSVAALGLENGWLATSGRRDPLPPVAFVAATASMGALLLARGVPWALSVGGLALFFACYYPWLAGTAHRALARAAVAAVFGLLHGMAFASALAVDRPAGAPPWPALLGFNVGVELGQLALLLIALPALTWIGRRPLASLTVSASGLGLGAFWFAVRALSS